MVQRDDEDEDAMVFWGSRMGGARLFIYKFGIVEGGEGRRTNFQVLKYKG